MLSSISVIGIALSLIAVSHAAELWAVEAGSVTGATPVDIGKLKNKRANTQHICPESYANGFSLECRGSDIRPGGGVSFFVNDNRVQTEWVSPPYMAAGDLDRGPDGLQFINDWTDYKEATNRCSKRNRDCVLKIKCTHGAGQVEKKLVIKKLEPGVCPPPVTVAPGEACDEVSTVCPANHCCWGSTGATKTCQANVLAGKSFNCGFKIDFSSSCTTADMTDLSGTPGAGPGKYFFEYDPVDNRVNGDFGWLTSTPCASGGPLNSNNWGTYALNFDPTFTTATGPANFCDGGSQVFNCNALP